MSRRIYKKPHRAKRQKPLYKKPLFWKSIVLLSLAGGGIWLVCFSPALEVKEITVAGTQKINQQECVKTIQDEVNKKIALFDSKSILLFDLDQTKKELMAQFPQLQNIKIERQFPSKIIASVEERRAVAVFESGGKRYSLDSDGIAFEESAADSGDLLKITDSGIQIELGKPAVARDMMQGILRLKSGVNLAGITVTEAAIATPERINLLTRDGWYVYFNPLKDIDGQLAKLAAVMADDSFKSKKANLEYADVRFTRVYLKEKP